MSTLLQAEGILRPLTSKVIFSRKLNVIFTFERLFFEIFSMKCSRGKTDKKTRKFETTNFGEIDLAMISRKKNHRDM